MAPGPSTTRTAAIINAADWERSPRAQAHAAAFLQKGYALAVYSHGRPGALPALAAFANWRFEPLERAGRAPTGAGFDAVLATTPPVFSAFRHLHRVRRRPGTVGILDWHNFGASRLALKWGRWHPAVAAHHALEKWGRPGRGVRHLAVSHAMADRLRSEYGLAEVRVLRDAPASTEQKEPPLPRAAVLEAAGLDPDWADACWVAYPHSWGDDEGFSWLLDLADGLERQLEAAGARLLVWVTGRGPGKAAFERRSRDLPGWALLLRTTWIPPDKYFPFLKACDAGLCLHRSSSGLDLPRKLSDFRAAGLPALAYRYGAVLDEVFTEGRHGWFFRKPAALKELLGELAAGVRQPALPPPRGEEWFGSWNRAMEGWLP